MKKVFCIGEVLIDFICCNNAPLNEGKYFEKKRAVLQQMLRYRLQN